MANVPLTEIIFSFFFQCLAIPVVLMVASASAPINALVPTVLVDPNAWTRLALSFAKTEECALCHQIHANAERDFTGGDATGSKLDPFKWKA